MGGGGGGRGGEGRLVMTNFQLLFLSPNLLKYQSPIMVCGGGGGGVLVMTNFPTFAPDSKFAKFTKFHYSGEGEGLMMTNFQSQVQTSKTSFQTKLSISRGGGGGGGGGEVDWWQPLLVLTSCESLE